MFPWQNAKLFAFRVMMSKKNQDQTGGAAVSPGEVGALAQLSRVARLAHYADGQTIHMRGDVKPGLSIVRMGAVRIGNPGLNGAYVTASIMKPGEVFGEASLFADLPRTHEAIAIGPTEIEQIDRASFFSVLERSPELAHEMLRIVTSRLYNVLDALDDLQRLPASVRVSKLLLSEEEQGEVHHSHSSLADLLGLSRVSVGNALGELRALGLVVPGYGRITINKAGLCEYVATRQMIPPLKPQQPRH